MDELRQTGRTIGMVRQAVKSFIDGFEVVIVVANEREKDRIPLDCRRLGMWIDPKIKFMTLAAAIHQLKGRHSRVYIDHYVWDFSRSDRCNTSINLFKDLVMHSNAHSEPDKTKKVVRQASERFVELATNTAEHFFTLWLSSSGDMLGVNHVRGVENEVAVDIYGLAFAGTELGAKFAVLGHNHPSGDVTPSPEDFSSTKLVVNALKQYGIIVLDHVIVSKSAPDRWFMSDSEIPLFEACGVV